MKRMTLGRRRRNGGVTLIELLVAMAIGLVVTLAVTSMVIVGESRKRSTTSFNDANQSGNYAAYVLDRALRSAGSGFTQAWDLGIFGCQLNIKRGSDTVLPRTTAFPAPFTGVPQAVRVAPVLIYRPASGSDVLIVMGGNSSAGDIARPVRSAGSAANKLRLDNTIGLRQGDIGLLSRNGTADCLVEQVHANPAFVDAAGNDNLPLGGTYYATSGQADNTDLATFIADGTAFFTPIGNLTANNLQLQMFGVNADRTLVSYDLMQTAGGATAAIRDAQAQQGIADGVVALRAVYAIDKNEDGNFDLTNDAWVAPNDTAYNIPEMMSTPAKVRRVLAVRVAMVLRSTNYEKEVVSKSSLTLFNDLPDALNESYAISGDDLHFNHRVVEFTVPLRNMLLLPTS